jgi:hypothetical protein
MLPGTLLASSRLTVVVDVHVYSRDLPTETYAEIRNCLC